MIRFLLLFILFMLPSLAQQTPTVDTDAMEQRVKQRISEEYQRNARRAEGGAGGRYRHYSSNMTAEEKRAYAESPWYAKLWRAVRGVLVHAGFLFLIFVPASIVLMLIFYVYKRLSPSVQDDDTKSPD